MTKVRIMLYDMKQFFMGCVKVYLKLAKQNKSILNKPAPTPYLAEDDKDYDEDSEPKRHLQSFAAKVIMNILYGWNGEIRPSTFLSDSGMHNHKMDKHM